MVAKQGEKDVFRQDKDRVEIRGLRNYECNDEYARGVFLGCNCLQDGN